jgi:hypothetical protein
MLRNYENGLHASYLFFGITLLLLLVVVINAGGVIFSVAAATGLVGHRTDVISMLVACASFFIPV